MLKLDQAFTRIPPCGAGVLESLQSAWTADAGAQGGELHLALETYRSGGVGCRLVLSRGLAMTEPIHTEVYPSPGGALASLCDTLAEMEQPLVSGFTLGALRALREVIW